MRSLFTPVPVRTSKSTSKYSSKYSSIKNNEQAPPLTRETREKLPFVSSGLSNVTARTPSSADIICEWLLLLFVDILASSALLFAVFWIFYYLRFQHPCFLVFSHCLATTAIGGVFLFVFRWASEKWGDGKGVGKGVGMKGAGIKFGEKIGNKFNNNGNNNNKGGMLSRADRYTTDVVSSTVNALKNAVKVAASPEKKRGFVAPWDEEEIGDGGGWSDASSSSGDERDEGVQQHQAHHREGEMRKEGQHMQGLNTKGVNTKVMNVQVDREVLPQEDTVRLAGYGTRRSSGRNNSMSNSMGNSMSNSRGRNMGTTIATEGRHETLPPTSPEASLPSLPSIPSISDVNVDSKDVDVYPYEFQQNSPCVGGQGLRTRNTSRSNSKKHENFEQVGGSSSSSSSKSGEKSGWTTEGNGKDENGEQNKEPDQSPRFQDMRFDAGGFLIEGEHAAETRRTGGNSLTGGNNSLTGTLGGTMAVSSKLSSSDMGGDQHHALGKTTVFNRVPSLSPRLRNDQFCAPTGSSTGQSQHVNAGQNNNVQSMNKSRRQAPQPVFRPRGVPNVSDNGGAVRSLKDNVWGREYVALMDDDDIINNGNINNNYNNANPNAANAGIHPPGSKLSSSSSSTAKTEYFKIHSGGNNSANDEGSSVNDSAAGIEAGIDDFYKSSGEKNPNQNLSNLQNGMNGVSREQIVIGHGPGVVMGSGVVIGSENHPGSGIPSAADSPEGTLGVDAQYFHQREHGTSVMAKPVGNMGGFGGGGFGGGGFGGNNNGFGVQNGLQQHGVQNGLQHGGVTGNGNKLNLREVVGLGMSPKVQKERREKIIQERERNSRSYYMLGGPGEDEGHTTAGGSGSGSGSSSSATSSRELMAMRRGFVDTKFGDTKQFIQGGAQGGVNGGVHVQGTSVVSGKGAHLPIPVSEVASETSRVYVNAYATHDQDPGIYYHQSRVSNQNMNEVETKKINNVNHYDKNQQVGRTDHHSQHLPSKPLTHAEKLRLRHQFVKLSESKLDKLSFRDQLKLYLPQSLFNIGACCCGYTALLNIFPSVLSVVLSTSFCWVVVLATVFERARFNSWALFGALLILVGAGTCCLQERWMLKDSWPLALAFIAAFLKTTRLHFWSGLVRHFCVIPTVKKNKILEKFREDQRVSVSFGSHGGMDGEGGGGGERAGGVSHGVEETTREDRYHQTNFQYNGIGNIGSPVDHDDVQVEFLDENGRMQQRLVPKEGQLGGYSSIYQTNTQYDTKNLDRSVNTNKSLPESSELSDFPVNDDILMSSNAHTEQSQFSSSNDNSLLSSVFSSVSSGLSSGLSGSVMSPTSSSFNGTIDFRQSASMRATLGNFGGNIGGGIFPTTNNYSNTGKMMVGGNRNNEENLQEEGEKIHGGNNLNLGGYKNGSGGIGGHGVNKQKNRVSDLQPPLTITMDALLLFYQSSRVDLLVSFFAMLYMERLQAMSELIDYYRNYYGGRHWQWTSDPPSPEHDRHLAQLTALGLITTSAAGSTEHSSARNLFLVLFVSSILAGFTAFFSLLRREENSAGTKSYDMFKNLPVIAGSVLLFPLSALLPIQVVGLFLMVLGMGVVLAKGKRRG